jgi:FtsH-binding integral membrane protein
MSLYAKLDKCFNFTVSAVAVLLFAGITAFDIQAMRAIYHESSRDEIPNMVILGAFTMCLDFIIMFLHLLRLLGVKKD